MLFTALIIPQITFASWWNPLSWNWKALFNSSTYSQTQNSKGDTDIKNNNFASTTSEIKISQTKNIEKTTQLDTPVKISIQNSSLQSALASSTQISNPTNVQKNGYQVCSEAYINETWDGTITTNNNYNCVCQTGYAWNVNKASCQLPTHTASVDTPNNVMDAILHENDSQINTENVKKNSVECQTATDAYNQINQQNISAQSAYTAQYNQIIMSSDSAEHKANAISNLQQQKGFNNTDLASKALIASDAKNIACGTWLPTPKKIINTNCSITGSIANCFSL